MSKQIAAIGTGQMATALAAGLVQSGFCTGRQIVAYDPSPAARERFSEAIAGVQWAATGGDAVAQADTVLLAVKPHQLSAVAQQVRAQVTARQLLISIAAGVSMVQLSQWFGTERVVRVMPNTPCLVGCGVSAFAVGRQATDADAATVSAMMGSVGLALQVEEPMLDCVTGLSGSGPAYVYLMIEALADGGVRVGLTRQMALQMAAHTVPRRGGNGDCSARASGSVERPGRQSGRDHHCGAPGVGGTGAACGRDRGGAGRHAAIARAGPSNPRAGESPSVTYGGRFPCHQ